MFCLFDYWFQVRIHVFRLQASGFRNGLIIIISPLNLQTVRGQCVAAISGPSEICILDPCGLNHHGCFDCRWWRHSNYSHIFYLVVLNYVFIPFLFNWHAILDQSSTLKSWKSNNIFLEKYTGLSLGLLINLVVWLHSLMMYAFNYHSEIIGSCTQNYLKLTSS